MSLVKEKKQKIVEDLRDRINRADILLFVNYHGLNVAFVQNLRDDLREKGIEYKVAKKTLLQKALHDNSMDVDSSLLEGEVGIVFGYSDPLEVAKEVCKFQQAHKDTFKVLGAVFEKQIFDKQMVESLARIPSRDVLLTQLTYLIASPLRGMVGVLQGNMRNLLTVLSGIQK